MDREDLQKLVETISIKWFKKPFRHQAYFNYRLRTTGGRYLLKSHNIEINPKYYEEKGIEEIEGIVKHELCHYHLHLEGKGYKHRDQDFKELLYRVKAPRYCTPLADALSKKRSYHLYECQECKQKYVRRRKIDVNRYVCGKCRGKLKKIESNVD